MVRILMLVLAAVGSGPGAWTSGLSAQVPWPSTYVHTFELVNHVARTAAMVQAFEQLEQNLAEPRCDRSRYRRDLAYRRDFQTRLRQAGEQRKKRALRFLDRFASLLEEGVGLYYRGRALNMAGDPHAAFLSLQAFRLQVRRHPARNRALLAIVDCLLQDRPEPDEARQRDRDKQRLSRARGFLSSLDRKALTPEESREAAKFRSRFETLENRVAFHDLEQKIREREREILLEGVSKERLEELRKRLPPEAMAALEESLGLRPDEVHYHDTPDSRTGYWKNRGRVERERQTAVREFYRRERARLEQGAGRVWKARALALAGDAKRAARAYQRFLEERPDHPEARAARVELAGLLVRRLDDRIEANRVLEELAGEELDEAQANTVQTLTERLRRGREQQQALLSPVGKPWRTLAGEPLEDGSPPRGLARQNLQGRVHVIVVFVTWSEPCRRLLARMAAEPVDTGTVGAKKPAVRVLGVTGRTGFGWKVEARTRDGFTGAPAGRDLSVGEERALAESLWKAAGFREPVVFVTAEAFARFSILPTVMVVDPEGVVRFAAAGVRAWPEAGKKARALAGVKRKKG